MYLEEHNDRVDAGDTVSGIAEGVGDADAGQIADAVSDDAAQTKDDVEDVVSGEDGNNQ